MCIRDRHHLDQPVIEQAVDRLPDRRAADARGGGDGLLGDHRARLELERDDLLLDQAVSLLGERLSAAAVGVAARAPRTARRCGAAGTACMALALHCGFRHVGSVS